jgi:solute carrier family 25 S-adenosylmethionine transporter 26
LALAPLQVRSILAKEGFRGLYAGYGAFMLRDLPFDAIEFVAYEQVRCGGPCPIPRAARAPALGCISASAAQGRFTLSGAKLKSIGSPGGGV